MQEALKAGDMGKVLLAFRNHPTFGGQRLAQLTLGKWIGMSQPSIALIESGTRKVTSFEKLTQWAQALEIPRDMWWFWPSTAPSSPNAQRACRCFCGGSEGDEADAPQNSLAPGCGQGRNEQPVVSAKTSSALVKAALVVAGSVVEAGGVLVPVVDRRRAR